MDCLTLRLLQKVCSYKCQFCTNVRAFSSLQCWSLTSSHDGWAKCKEKVPDVLDPNQNVETNFHSYTPMKKHLTVYYLLIAIGDTSHVLVFFP